MANEARHAAALGLKREVRKRKEKGGWGAEDERASPCQMKHGTQLLPAAVPTHLTCSPIDAPGAPNALFRRK